MRLLWAVVSFILGALCIGLGFADAALVDRPHQVTMTAATSSASPYTVLSSEALSAKPGEHTLDVRTDGTVFAAIGRTSDIEAWLATASYNQILPPVDANGTALQVKVVTATETPAGVTEAPETMPSPAGSDLWLAEFSEPDRWVFEQDLPDDVSVLLATDGVEPAPENIVISWPITYNKPWAGPLLVAGSIFLLLGVILAIREYIERKRGLGPRRKGPGQPTSGGSGQKKALPSSGRRAITSLIALPVAATILVTAGCSPQLWPQPAPTPTPTVTETPAEATSEPALIASQAARILDRVALRSLEADEANSGDIAAERLSGEALLERKSLYALKAALPERTVPPLLPTTDVKVLLPQANDAWPRTALVAVAGATETDAPVVMTMTQDDPWSNYKVSYRAEFIAGVQVPKLPPDWTGASLIPPGLTLFALGPELVGAAFADVIDNGEASEYYGSFDDNALAFAQSIRDKRDAANAQLVADDADTTSAYSWVTSASENTPIALSTWESGAIVAFGLQETEEYLTTDDDAVIRTSGSPAVQALTGKDEIEGGVRTVYGMQLFFSVPSAVSGNKIALLAKDEYLQSIVEIEKPASEEE